MSNADKLMQLISFKIGEQDFGVDILQVQEISRMVEIISLPRKPDYVVGVINRHEKVIPIVDLRKRFGLESKDSDKSTRIVVVEIEGSNIGLVVDSVSEVIRLPQESIEPALADAAGVNSKYINGITRCDDCLVIILDLPHVIDLGEISKIV